jgi:hypothetical protein
MVFPLSPLINRFSSEDSFKTQLSTDCNQLIMISMLAGLGFNAMGDAILVMLNRACESGVRSQVRAVNLVQWLHA